MSEPALAHTAEVSSNIGSAGVILLGAEAILILLLTYFLVEWGLSLVRKIKETDISLMKTKLCFAFPALLVSILPTVLAVAFIRFRLMGYNADLFISAWVVLGVLTVGFITQAALMIIFFKKAERISAGKNPPAAAPEEAKTQEETKE